MGQCPNCLTKEIFTKNEGRKELEKIKVLRQKLNENNDFLLVKEEENKSIEIKIMNIEDNEEEEEEKKKLIELKKKKLEEIRKQKLLKLVKEEGNKFLNGKMDDIYQKFKYSIQVNNYLNEEINDKNNNCNLVSPSTAISNKNYLIQFLGYLGGELSEYRIKTYIEIEPTNEIIRDITYKLIISGLATQRIYRIIINSSSNKKKFKENINLWYNYSQKIKNKLTESKKIKVYDNEIYFFNYDTTNFEVIMLIYNKRLKNVEDLLDSFDIKIIRSNLVNNIILSPNMFMIKFCKNINDWPTDSNLLRGGEKYYPPYGWMGLALKLKNKFGTNNSWLTKSGSNKNEWCVAYHGIGSGKGDVFKKVLSILNTNLREGPNQCFSEYPNKRKYTKGEYKQCEKGVYFSPDISKAENYAVKTYLGTSYKEFQFAIMARVNPRAIRDPGIFPVNWILNEDNEEIRPYRLLVKIS